MFAWGEQTMSPTGPQVQTGGQKLSSPHRARWFKDLSEGLGARFVAALAS